MKTVFDLPLETPDAHPLTAEQWRLLLVQKEATFNQVIEHKDTAITQRDNRIRLLEELLRLATIQRFAAKSEKLPFQIDLFDEAELEAALDELTDQVDGDEDQSGQPRSKKRQRGFSDDLERRRIELLLSEDDKAEAQRTFFTKVKEELEFIPAKMTVLEYWQEKAVFVDAEQTPRKRNPCGCTTPCPSTG